MKQHIGRAFIPNTRIRLWVRRFRIARKAMPALADQEKHEMPGSKIIGEREPALRRKAPVQSGRRVATKAGADADLIRMCREFEVLERRILIATLGINNATGRDRITTPLYRRQDVLLDRIHDTTPQTLAGCKALASILSLLTKCLGQGGRDWGLLMSLLGSLETLKG